MTEDQKEIQRLTEILADTVVALETVTVVAKALAGHLGMSKIKLVLLLAATEEWVRKSGNSAFNVEAFHESSVANRLAAMVNRN